MTSMTSTPEDPLPLGRPQYRRTLSGRIIGWLRTNLFASIPSSIMSLLLILVLGKALVSLVQWGITNAIWIISGDQTGPCRAIRGIGGSHEAAASSTKTMRKSPLRTHAFFEVAASPNHGTAMNSGETISAQSASSQRSRQSARSCGVGGGPA